MSRLLGSAARQVIAIIERRGWHQGGWTGETGAVCIRGAFNIANYGLVAMHPSLVEQKFTEWMTELGVLPDSDAGEPCLAGWNDDESRTKEEVLAYLNKFAEEHDPQPVLP